MKNYLSLLSLILYCSNLFAEQVPNKENVKLENKLSSSSELSSEPNATSKTSSRDSEEVSTKKETDIRPKLEEAKEVTPQIEAEEAYSLKGKFYIIWGWNQSYYTDSDIRFKGDDYNFTLYRVDAYDRQSKFNSRLYFGLDTLTIPQYNFKIGYYFTDRLSVNLSFDHMKYVMKQNQTTKIKGKIANSGTSYDGEYDAENFLVASDFLKFEHTDGLNYLNIELSYLTNIFATKKSFVGEFDVNIINGASLGIMVPRSNVTLLGNERHDEWNVAGAAASFKGATQFLFAKRFFIQPEIEAGYIDMWNIRTTKSTSDEASQKFFFTQAEILFGFMF